jgi:type I restriction enzyme R subunit
VDDVPEAEEPHKYYVDEGAVEIVHQLVYELDTEGNRLRCAQYSDYAADKVRSLYPNAADLRHRWADAVQRREIIDQLEERGISFEELAAATGRPEADPFDLLCHLAYNAPLRTRRERADRLRKDQQDHFERYGPEARAILDDLLTKYAEHGLAQFALPDVLKLPPISQRGNVSEIARLFGGAEQLRAAVADLQAQLYAA